MDSNHLYHAGQSSGFKIATLCPVFVGFLLLKIAYLIELQ